MARSGLVIVKAGLWDTPPDFRCRKPEFAEYLGVDAAYDQQQRMGQLYWATYNEEIVGYMMLALGHAMWELQSDLGIDTYGHIPALVITRLATDERYERQGVGGYMVSYAADVAGRIAPDVGCRVVLASSVPDAVEFYEKMGFSRFTVQESFDSARPGRESIHSTGAGADVEEELVHMYLDMGARDSGTMASGGSA